MPSIDDEVKSANEEAVSRMMESIPYLVEIKDAREVISLFSKEEMALTHAGPPLTWDRMSGPLKGAILGAAIYEGWASSVKEAEKLASSGKIRFDSNHHHGAVGPMAGVISPSMKVFVVKNLKYGNLSYTNLNEGLGKVLRYGAYSKDVLDKLKWLNETLGNVLSEAVRLSYKIKGGIDLKNMIAQALHMGDECHNRNIAATSLFFKEISRYVIELYDRKTANEALSFISGNDVFFVNLAMAACKAMADAAHGIEYSTIVTAVSRNGTEVGIRVSGLGDKWFKSQASIPKGLFFPGFSQHDANPDIGDSTITETAGIGGMAMATSPAIVKFIGGTFDEIVKITEKMYSITFTAHKYFTIPYLGFKGTPTGIDVRKVVQNNMPPIANTGIAHKEPGIGQVGAGIVEFPLKPFKEALSDLSSTYGA